MDPHLKHREQPYAPCIPAGLRVVLKRQLRGTDLCGQGKLARGHGVMVSGRRHDALSQPWDDGPMQLRWRKIYTLPEKKTHGYPKGSALENVTPLTLFKHGNSWYQFVRFLECNPNSQVPLNSHHLFKKVTNISSPN